MSIHPPEAPETPAAPAHVSDAEVRLHVEVQRLYAVEARLLDQHRYADWLELFAEDLHYWAPVRTNRLRRQQSMADGAPGEVAVFDETKASLAWRIRRFDSGMAWAEDPPSRTRHLVTNVLVEPGEEPGTYTATSDFLCYRNRLEREVDLYAGGRTDTLRRTGDGGLLIARRTILLDQNVLLAKNISTFL
ncbi:3-phenylpropionate/cinnamic acid dioxygenase subunit beta [Streptomyces acidiscabies]|uniref:3-phenylpropionate/cinnamic acid dioxygenase subunit beta n=1 Tax=Streptomyces acidiscabies TaxID=42234 RepID=A0AAP6BEN4_9ACTN|nr:3-phenylpropionate/cinnamic acid dioxygenase subunit beta [Streptomyces acidiscabies]MBP5941876.1 3-phenylpropionate/cinnamic acid dioxygenase subunit beta [Streptomyces sp. LBUM 1476]MBZ3913311.1 3-phenylpropionate/cinnamic acid dioxygenase subunit beta [Streptomyces acidiscabies]MDX2963263.1 3-phenylpropionate/cinnamic acid dioxygenase subunit beta [Streptomyces acidiscabies]MDX3021519.1 3-phenylpropionate/cinnamic acid dioxygenase subunit beta [Streptomyces acidiscabies]MDX3790278.1 3-ph